MNFYFDNVALNLSHVKEVQEIRKFDQFKDYYNVGDAQFLYTTEYNDQGVYLIETSKLTHQWTGDTSSAHSFNLIKEIPEHVVEAARNKTLRIVIISIVEGDHYVKDYYDGFRQLTNNINARNLPPFSVLIMAGQVRAAEEYALWCKQHNEQPIIEFIGASEGPSEIPKTKVDPIAAILAQSRQEPYAYSSLNRAHRQHRTEHLYVLAKTKILDKGLVSGGIFFKQEGIHSPKFANVKLEEWGKVLNKHYPKSVDFGHLELKSNNPANNLNLDIYNNAMLSVVSETYFSEPGLFLSEKVFKPVSVGSPQMTLAQPYIIKYMKQKFSINLSFPGVDTSYDNIEDPASRFAEFHKSLINWVKTPDKIRRKMCCIWEEQLKANRDIIYNTNFKKIIVDDIINSTRNYFATQTD
jgi:hypothetical protein